MGYYGLSMNISALAGNLYLNLFIGGAMELPVQLSMVYIVGRFGRKKPTCLLLLIGGAMCAAAVMVPKSKGKNI